MKILVTGAYGFTGRYFVNEAIRQGHEVIELKSNLNDNIGLQKEISLVLPDAVVHLAGISFVAHDNPIDFYRVNVLGTENLLNALVKLELYKIRVLIASSANVYGAPNIEMIDENIPCKPLSHYGLSKVAMEQLAKTFEDRLSIIITRPFNYTGLGQSEIFLIPKIIAHYKQKRPYIELGNVDVYRDFSDVRDVVKIYCQLLEESFEKVVLNVCSGKMYALTEIIEMTEQISHHHLAVRVNPRFVRDNEIKKFCGDNSKLKAITGESSMRPFRDTLSWMLT